MKKFFEMPALELAIMLTVLNITAVAGPAAVCNQTIDYCERLFPLSCYGQAVEICMRVLADPMHQYDRETTTDLCVGRLFRLSNAVVQMEHTHLTKKPYPPEDITYIISLMGAVHKERQEDLCLSQIALSMVASIESRLELLLRYP